MQWFRFCHDLFFREVADALRVDAADLLEAPSSRARRDSGTAVIRGSVRPQWEVLVSAWIRRVDGYRVFMDTTDPDRSATDSELASPDDARAARQERAGDGDAT